MAVGSGSGMTGRTPGFFGGRNAMPQWVLNTAGCSVKTSYPNVPHPSVQLTADKHTLRWTFKIFIYSYVGNPSRGANRHSVNAPKILSVVFFRAMSRTF